MYTIDLSQSVSIYLDVLQCKNNPLPSLVPWQKLNLWIFFKPNNIKFLDSYLDRIFKLAADNNDLRQPCTRSLFKRLNQRQAAIASEEEQIQILLIYAEFILRSYETAITVNPDWNSIRTSAEELLKHLPRIEQGHYNKYKDSDFIKGKIYLSLFSHFDFIFDYDNKTPRERLKYLELAINHLEHLGLSIEHIRLSIVIDLFSPLKKMSDIVQPIYMNLMHVIKSGNSHLANHGLIRQLTPAWKRYRRFIKTVYISKHMLLEVLTKGHYVPKTLSKMLRKFEKAISPLNGGLHKLTQLCEHPSKIFDVQQQIECVLPLLSIIKDLHPDRVIEDFRSNSLGTIISSKTTENDPTVEEYINVVVKVFPLDSKAPICDVSVSPNESSSEEDKIPKRVKRMRKAYAIQDYEYEDVNENDEERRRWCKSPQ